MLGRKVVDQLQTRADELTALVTRDRLERARIDQTRPRWRVGPGRFEERQEFAIVKNNIASERRNAPKGVADSNRGGCRSRNDPEIPKPITDQPCRNRRDRRRTV